MEVLGKTCGEVSREGGRHLKEKAKEFSADSVKEKKPNFKVTK